MNQPWSKLRAQWCANSSDRGPMRRRHSRPAEEGTGALFFLPSAFLLACTGLLLGHLCPGPARFRQPDGDCLLATLDLGAGTSALQLAALHLMHGLLDLASAGFAVFS